MGFCGPMAADAQPVINLTRIELYALFVFLIVGVSLLLVTVRAFAKLFAIGYLLDGMMAADAGDSLASFMRERGIGVYSGLVDLMIEQDQSAPARGVQPDVDSLCLSVFGSLCSAG